MVIFGVYLFIGLVFTVLAFYDEGELKVKQVPFIPLLIIIWPVMAMLCWESFEQSEFAQKVIWKRKN